MNEGIYVHTCEKETEKELELNAHPLVKIPWGYFLFKVPFVGKRK